MAIVILEAMKMQNPLFAPLTGKVHCHINFLHNAVIGLTGEKDLCKRRRQHC